MDRSCPNLQIIIKIGMRNSFKNTHKWIAYQKFGNNMKRILRGYIVES